jgi:hypothetical protein
MSKTIVLNLKANTKEAEKEIKNVAKEVENTNKATLQLESTFDKATGGLVSKTKGAIGTVQNLGKGFLSAGANAVKMGNLVKIALTSTGIGALLVAFGSLLTFFTKTQRGADQVKQAFAGIQAAVSAVVDRISNLGEAFTKLFSGDFSGALETAKQSFKGLGDEIRSEVAAAVELEQALQRIRDREIDLIVSNAQLRKAIAEDKLLAEDRNKTFEERLSALDRVLSAEDALLQQRLEIAREEARISDQQVALGESTREEIRANQELQARVIELETESLTRQKEAFTRRQALLQESNAAEAAALKEQFDARQAFNQAVAVVDDNAVGRLQAKVQLETRLYKDGLAEQTQAYQDAKLEEQAADKITNKQKLQLVSQTFGAIAGILGENSKAGKAAAIAQATINTYQGITEVLANKTTIPEPFGIIQKVASVGTVLATGLQAVRTIKAQPLPQVRVAPSFGGGGGGGVAAPSPPSFNVVGASPESQLAQAIGGQSREPVKAYVVAGEVTTAQSLERNTIKEASI